MPIIVISFSGKGDIGNTGQEIGPKSYVCVIACGKKGRDSLVNLFIGHTHSNLEQK